MDEERDWLPGMTISLDPDAIEDYEMDFARWLRGETLASVSVIHENCTAVQHGALQESVVIVRVSEVTAGASVTIRPVSAGGRRSDFTINFKPKPQ